MRAKVLEVKSNMAASSSQMFCLNCGAEAVPKVNLCTRCGQGNMFQAYFEYRKDSCISRTPNFQA